MVSNRALAIRMCFGAVLLAVGGMTLACGGDSVGTGELTVAGQAFAFEVDECIFGDEQTGSEDIAFHLTGSGDDDGRAYAVEARLIDLGDSGLGQTQYVGLRFQDAEEGYESLPDLSGQGSSLEVEDGDVSFEGDFTTVADQEPAGPGRFTATCP
ncbi:MAG: hypothetical protein U5Q44_00795 [Dehalococcoidia bacterium]|nr:hypothetical protein [Dehalococcoidia bacterium]